MLETKSLPKDVLLEDVKECDLCGKTSFNVWDFSRGNTLLQCGNCSLIFSSPRITNLKEKDKVIYAKSYFKQKSRMTQDHLNARKICYQMEIQDLEKLKSGGKIFDVGCGEGFLLQEMKDTAWEKYGSDISSFAVEEAKAKGIEAYLGEFESLDLKENFFDVVYFRASLHHTLSPSKSVRKAYSILKPGGLLVITMNNNSSGPMGKIFKGHVKSYEQAHNFLFTKKTLIRLLEENNFKPLKIKYPFFGTGYGSVIDAIMGIPKWFMYMYAKANGSLNSSKFADLASPAFYGNYINVYCKKEIE